MPAPSPDWMKDWLRPGRPVVCVSEGDAWQRLAFAILAQRLPVLRGVYTIRAVRPGHGRDVLLLEEITNAARAWPACPGVFEVGFSSHLFRPVRPASIEHIRHACLPRPIYVHACVHVRTRNSARV